MVRTADKRDRQPWTAVTIWDRTHKLFQVLTLAGLAVDRGTSESSDEFNRQSRKVQHYEEVRRWNGWIGPDLRDPVGTRGGLRDDSP